MKKSMFLGLFSHESHGGRFHLHIRADLPAKDAFFMPHNHQHRSLTVRPIRDCINPEQQCIELSNIQAIST